MTYGTYGRHGNDLYVLYDLSRTSRNQKIAPLCHVLKDMSIRDPKKAR